ncbi:conserved hypothetical protein [uncultured Gammaproteobacteria bacterium]
MVDAVGQSSILNQVKGLNDSIAAAMERLKTQAVAEGDGIGEPAAAQKPTGAVTEYQKTVKKSASSMQYFASDAGVLVKNTSRLNIISKLKGGDAVDFYKFRVIGNGQARLGQTGDEGTRTQIMSYNGKVIADSNKDSKDAYTNFRKLQAGTLELSSGQYTVRVSREKGVDPKADKNYALQLQMGDYKQDYETVAKQPAAGENPYALSTVNQSLLDSLNTSVGFMNSLNYGQTGSNKLLGMMFNGKL